MDENNMNNLNNGVDEEDEATTVLVAPGVGAAQPPKPEAKADSNWGAAQSSQSNDYGNNQFGGQQANGYGQNQFGGNNQFGGQQANGYAPNQFGGQQMNGYTPNQFGGQTPSDIKPGKKISKKMLAIIGGAAAVVIIALVLILTLGGSGAKSIDKITDKMVAAYEDDDSDAIYDLYYDKYLDGYAKEYDYTDKELKEAYKDDYDYYKDELADVVGDIKSIKVTKVKNDSSDYDKDDIKEINDEFKDDYNVDLNIKEITDVTVYVDIEGSEDDCEGWFSYTAVKVGSKWYIVDNDELEEY